MLKELFEHIQKTAHPLITNVDGHTFRITSDGDVSELIYDHFRPDTLQLHSLDALVKLVRTEATEDDTPLYITIPDHLTARCFAQFDRDDLCHRQIYYEARATDVPGWDSRMGLGFEEAQIAMRTRFQDTPDVLYLQKLLSDISCGGKVTLNDNGIATSVVTQKGVALQTNEAIRPIVTLRPYRTFQEVKQPESPFLIRVNERQINFIEADGGMWKLKARETVKAHLEQLLAEEVACGAVVIAL